MLGRLKLARLVVLTFIAVLSTISGCSKDKNPTKPPITVGHVWSALGSGMSSDSGIGPLVSDLTVYNGQLLAGGLFSTAGGVSAHNIAAWSD